MKIGVLIHLPENISEIDEKFKAVSDLGFESCQLCCWKPWLFTQEAADCVNAACEKYKVEISTFWCGWTGPAKWNFYEGPVTLGLVPEEYRFARAQELIKGSDFAKMLGVENMATHAGFLPEVPVTESYASLVSALKYVAEHCKENNQYFLFETGQETPVTLLRMIEDIGMENLGINLDPANLIMYGKANPIDALDVFGKYVRDVHAKDGCYPTDAKNLGCETPLGKGKVNFPEFIKKLKEVGYDGALTIEREIAGEEQIRDVIAGKKLLEEYI